MNEEKSSINEYTSKRYCLTAIVIILMWWISYILLESFKLSFNQHKASFNYQILALMLLSPLIFYIQMKRRMFLKGKYNICKKELDSKKEYVLVLLISIIYAQILSFAIESMMAFAV